MAPLSRSSKSSLLKALASLNLTSVETPVRGLANVLKGHDGGKPAAWRKNAAILDNFGRARRAAFQKFPATCPEPLAKPTETPTQQPPPKNKLTQLILIFRMRWTRAALRAAFSDDFSEAFLFSLATIRAFRRAFR